jgi:hypothetical protein
MEFNRLKDEIQKAAPHEPVFIYIGVGTMAGLRNSDGTLAEENYHQYPPFVKELRNRIPCLNMFLILVDPLQENPPYLLRDYPLQEVDENHYKSNDSRLQVFVHRNVVYTEPDDKDNYTERGGINITELLRDLNDFALQNRASLLYHDFTGRRTGNLAEYFDNDYALHLDQIVYAMSAREDHGCYFDLSKPDAFFAIKICNDANVVINNIVVNNNVVGGCGGQASRPIVKMFNYFKYIVNDTYEKAEEERKTYPTYMQPFIDEQQQHIINSIRTEFKNINIATLRQIKKILLNPLDDVDPNLYLYNGFNKPLRDFLLDLLKNKEYVMLEEILFNLCSSKLDIIARLKNLDLTGEQILRFITADADPYQWYKSIDGFLLGVGGNTPQNPPSV